MENTKELKKPFMSWPELTLVIVAAFVGIYIFLAAMPFVGPYFQYPLHVIRCGKQPIIASEFMSKTYMTPESNTYAVKGNSQFFCSEQEALDKGYSKIIEFQNTSFSLLNILIC